MLSGGGRDAARLLSLLMRSLRANVVGMAPSALFTNAANLVNVSARAISLPIPDCRPAARSSSGRELVSCWMPEAALETSFDRSLTRVVMLVLSLDPKLVLKL